MSKSAVTVIARAETTVVLVSLPHRARTH